MQVVVLITFEEILVENSIFLMKNKWGIGFNLNMRNLVTACLTLKVYWMGAMLPIKEVESLNVIFALMLTSRPCINLVFTKGRRCPKYSRSGT